MRSSPADSTAGEGGGQGGSRIEIPLQLIEKIMVKQIESLDTDDYTGEDIHTAPVEDPCQSR